MEPQKKPRKNYIAQCEICYEQYNSQNKVPIRICSNIHLMCLPCYNKGAFTEDENGKKTLCPLCREKVNVDKYQVYDELLKAVSIFQSLNMQKAKSKIRFALGQIHKQQNLNQGSIAMDIIQHNKIKEDLQNEREKYKKLEQNYLKLQKQNEELKVKNQRLIQSEQTLQEKRRYLEENQKNLEEKQQKLVKELEKQKQDIKNKAQLNKGLEEKVTKLQKELKQNAKGEVSLPDVIKKLKDQQAKRQQMKKEPQERNHDFDVCYFAAENWDVDLSNENGLQLEEEGDMIEVDDLMGETVLNPESD